MVIENNTSVSQGDTFQPSSGFKVQLRIKDKEYTNSLAGVRIASTLAASYQNIELVMDIPAKDALLNNLSGKDPIKLKVSLRSQNQSDSRIVQSEEKESVIFDLMLISVEFQVAVSPQSFSLLPESSVDRSMVRLITVPRKPFQTMTTLVNDVFGVTDSPKSPKEIIQGLVGSISTSPSLTYDNLNINSDKIPQVCIPPTTFSSAIKHLDDLYGLFNGVSTAFCQYDNNVHVMNLSSRMQKSTNRITVYHLGMQDIQTAKQIGSNADDKDVYYTYDNLYTSYVGNTKFSVIGNQIRYIVLPSDTLYHTVSKSLDEICSSYGIIDQNKNVPIEATSTNRRKYYILHGGYEKTETFVNAVMAKKIYDLARISFQLERHTRIINLMNIGQTVKLKIRTAEHTPLGGKYILFSSDIMLIKDRGGWGATSRLELARTNRIIGQ